MEKSRLINPILLGIGNFARVYRVEDRYTGELYACKISSYKALADREKLYLEHIKHPLFPAYQGAFNTENEYCILMEYISGCNLKEFVARRGALKEAQAIRIAQELAEGLLYLHEHTRPMIYRDLKPENVMIQADGKVRLVDVGCIDCSEEPIADGKQMKDAESGDNACSRQITRAGTPGYAAPEQFRADSRCGIESDVYALGKVLEFMLTSREVQGNVVAGSVEATTRYKKRQPKLTRRMRIILHMTTRTDRKRRIQDMRILLQMLSRKRKTAPDFYYEKNIYKGL